MQNIIVTGDINIPINPGKIDTSSENYLTLTSFHGLLPAHTFITRDLSGTCLDHVLVKTKKPSTTIVPQSTLTDHKCVLFCLNHKISNTETFYQTKVNNESLEKDILNIDTKPIYQQTDPNQSITYLIKAITTAINKNTETKIIPRRKKIMKPWITQGLLRCMRHRDKLHKKSNQNPNDETLKITYKRYRNFCNGLLKKLKRQYDRDNISNAGNDSKRLWKAIKDITNTSKTKNYPKELLSAEITPQVAVNKVNEYYVKVGESLAERIPQTNDGENETINDKSSNNNSFFLGDTDEREVEQIIMGLRTTCAMGVDQISNKILKDFKDFLVPPITFIFNQCLQLGIFPRDLKVSKVLPIHKGGDRDRVNNYRPISILPSLSKILEKIINKRLVNYLEKNNVLSKNQFGFRQNKSTDDAVLSLTEFVATKLDNSKKCISIFIDLAKAFDTVSVPLLMNKLEKIGIRGAQLELFKDYLSERHQCVSIGEHTSALLPILYGVPQGSILGPTLFLIYINNLLSMNMKLISYADDTALLFSADSWEEAFTEAQRGFNAVGSWLRRNLLSLNVEKTKYMTFSIRSSGQPSDDFTIFSHTCPPGTRNCNCPSLERVKCIKYLGVLIDNNLSFKPHIDLLTTRIRKLIFIFKSLRHILDSSKLKQIYFALCQSLLNYCISSWGGAHKTNLKSVEVAQRAILKVCTFRPFRYPTTLLYEYCEVLTVRQLFLLSIIKRQHSELIFNPSILKRRRKHTICKSRRFNTVFIRKFFCFLGPFIYNRINKTKFIYCLNGGLCKREVTKWLLTLNYVDTEDLLAVMQ